MKYSLYVYTKGQTPSYNIGYGTFLFYNKLNQKIPVNVIEYYNVGDPRNIDKVFSTGISTGGVLLPPYGLINLDSVTASNGVSYRYHNIILEIEDDYIYKIEAGGYCNNDWGIDGYDLYLYDDGNNVKSDLILGKFFDTTYKTEINTSTFDEDELYGKKFHAFDSVEETAKILMPNHLYGHRNDKKTTLEGFSVDISSAADGNVIYLYGNNNDDEWILLGEYDGNNSLNEKVDASYYNYAISASKFTKVSELRFFYESYIYSENISEPGKYTLSEIYAISHSEVYSEYFKIGDKVLVKPTKNSNSYFVLSILEFDEEADFHVKFKFDGIIDENNIFISVKDYIATKIGEINIPIMTDYSVGDYTISDKGHTYRSNYSYKAFDGDLNTYWEYNYSSDKSWYVDITHNSLYMQPKKIKAYFKDDGYWVGDITCYFQGLNEITSEWETIGSFVIEKNVYNELDCSSNNKFYKSLRLCADNCTNSWYTWINDVKIEGDLYNISSNNFASILNNGTISNTFDILNINIDDTIKESISPIPYTTSTITISNVNGLYIGQDLVVKKDNEIIFTTTIDNKKNYNTRIIDEGQYSIFVRNKNGEYIYEENIDIVLGENYLVDLKPMEVVSWSEGSWGNISLMLKAHYRGELNIADYWSVGDKRIINISDVPAYNGVTTQPAQAVELTIISTSGEDVMEDGTKSAITVRCGLLSQMQQMHSTDAQSISSSYEGWKTLDMYNWLNNQFFNALDPKLQSLIKPVKVISHWYIASSYYPTSVVTTYDKVFLPSISQMYTTQPTSDCNMDEGTQYEYFKTASNIIIESDKYTMTRSTMTMSADSGSVDYCYTTSDSSASYGGLTTQTYVAPMFCL